jgi:hypothetical protein
MDPTNPADLQELQQAIFNQRLYNAAFAISSLLSNVIAIWVATRRSPPLDRELSDFRKRADCIATHQALKDDHRQEHDAELARQNQLHAEIAARFSKGEDLFRDIYNVMGRLASSVETLSERLRRP